ncbi:MAG: phosphodiester glycosidase family protein [Actinomycetota bacterium]
MGRALGVVLVVLAVLIAWITLPTVQGVTLVADDHDRVDPAGPAAAQDRTSDEITATGTSQGADGVDADVLSVDVPDGDAVDADERFVPGSPVALAECDATEAGRMAPLNAIIDASPAERIALRTPDFEQQYRRAVVGTMYCKIFLRPADDEGITYWSGQLADGLSIYDLYLVLAASEEYQQREVLTQTEVLESLQVDELVAGADPGGEPGDTTDELEAAAPQTATESTSQTTSSVAPEQTTTVPTTPETSTSLAEARDLARELDEASQLNGLRVRIPITEATFEDWVNGKGLNDLDQVTDALVHGTRHRDGQMVNVAYVHLSRTRGVSVSPGSNRRAAVGTWADTIGAHVAINGNWYGPWDGPAVSGGVVYAGSDHNYTSLFGFTEFGDSIIEHHREVNDQVDPRIVEGVSGHPTLIHRGEPTVDFGTDPTFLNRNPRTAIGLDESGDVLILVTVDGRRSSAIGMTGAETVELMAELGAYDAVMLDGGGSSTMWLAGRGVVNQPSGGLRSVGNQLAVFGN